MRKTLAVVAGVAATFTLCVSTHAALIQGGAGGTTNPPDNGSDQIGVTLNSGAFASVGLWDSVSGTVGGGAVSGDLYYAFVARPLDREGDSSWIPAPPGPVGGLPTPSNSRGGGLISRGSTEILGVGDNSSAYAYSTFGALTGNADLSNRLDLSPNLPVTFLVHIQFNAGGNDNITVTGTSPFSTTTHVRSATGDASFDAFAFMSDTSNTTDNRWEFSNVIFATTAAEALSSLPEPTTWALLVMGALTLGGLGLLRRRR